MTTQNNSIRNPALFQSYKDYLRLNDYSVVYINPTKKFLNYCDSKAIDVLHINLSQLSEYILLLKQSHSNGYVNNFIKAIKSLFSFIRDYGHLPPDSNAFLEVSKLRLLRIENRIKDTINLKQLEDIIKKAVGYQYAMNSYKIRAVLYFMYFTGVRKAEICNIARRDILLEEGKAIIRIPTKNRSERVVFFPQRTTRALKDYFAVEPERINAFNVTRSNITNLFIFLKNFNKSMTPHMMRHSFTQLLAEQGIDIRVAQQLLGHKSIQSTMIYYNPNVETVGKIYRERIR